MDSFKNSKVIVYNDLFVYAVDVLTYLDNTEVDIGSITEVECIIHTHLSCCRNVLDATLNGLHLKDISYYLPVAVKIKYENYNRICTKILCPLDVQQNIQGLYLLLDISKIGKLKNSLYTAFRYNMGSGNVTTHSPDGNTIKILEKFIEQLQQHINDTVEVVHYEDASDGISRLLNIDGISDKNIIRMDDGLIYNNIFLNSTNRRYITDTIHRMSGGGNVKHIINTVKPFCLDGKQIIGVFTTYNDRLTTNTDEHYAIVDTCRYCQKKYIYDYYAFGKVRCCCCNGVM